ncbi:MAG: C39 family peptidase [Terrimicrobiaceae bacterium]|nr:C39 family peptidase [Terrimicrobiaceae bacterium]
MTARRIFIFAAIAFLAALGWGAWYWITPRAPLAPSGGLYFPGEKVLDVPQFFQGDPRWAADPLGPTPATMGAEGCAVASAAMVLASYGADVDPGRLNAFATRNAGYTPQGWLVWEAAAGFPPAIARKAYEDKPSYALIDRNLFAGNPVIVRIRHPAGGTHFVVIVGKRGFDYLIRDPGSGGARGVYPLKDFGQPIEALRFFEKTAPGAAPWPPANMPTASTSGGK